MKKIKVKITATVTTTIEIQEGEDLNQRIVDIYLHDQGDNGHLNKVDLGSDSTQIEILEDKNICSQFTLSGNNMLPEKKRLLNDKLTEIAKEFNLEPQSDGDLVYTEEFQV